MAAVDPSESQEREKSPAEEAKTSGDEAEESGYGPEQKGDPTPDKSRNSPVKELSASGSVGSHSGVSVAAGADTATCVVPEDSPAAGKMVEGPGGDQQTLEWSEAEDVIETSKQHLNNKENKCELEDVTATTEEVEKGEQVADNIIPVSEVPSENENSHCNDKIADKSPALDSKEEAEDIEEMIEDEEETDSGDDADGAIKQKKCSLECKECGEKFNRRETFNLHRHSHSHEDELTPLTCKECGLTFQHRSSLIKHRNEHKEKEEQLLHVKNEIQTKEEGRFQCAECLRIFSTVKKLRDHNCSTTIEKLYHCPLCRQEFQFKVSVTKHMASHSQECVFKCQECNQAFPNVLALHSHQKGHAALKPYECPQCGMVFKHYFVMEDHRRKHSENNRSHLCNICGKTFKYTSLLQQHQFLHTGKKPFCCPDCGKTFAFAQNMKAHWRQHRLTKTDLCTELPNKQSPISEHNTIKETVKENTQQSEKPKNYLNCPLCPQTFSQPATLKNHMLGHEAEYERLEREKEPNKYWEKGHTCPHCPSTYRSESSLKQHIVSVHKKNMQDSVKMTDPPSQLDSKSEQRKTESLNVRLHKCSECTKTFRHRSVLELHMRIHSKDKPYQCKVCGKGFRFSSYLQQHLIIHTGKKPYKCSDCGKEFAFLQNMRTHQKLHQEKPFRCTGCRKGYSDETQLQQHMLSHNGEKPHKCNLCDKSFGLAYLLRDHMNTHTGERPHRCDECHKSFSWLSSLLVHQKIHTRKKPFSSQPNSSITGTKMRGRGRGRGRGRRGGKLMWGWSRSSGGSATVGHQQPPHPISPLKDTDLDRKAPQDLPSRQLKDPELPEPQPMQCQVDGGEMMPVPSAQQPHSSPQQVHIDSLAPAVPRQHPRSPGRADAPLLNQSGQTSAHSSDVQTKDSSVINSLPISVPKKPSPPSVSEIAQQRQPKPATWSGKPTSTVPCSTSSVQPDFSVSSSYVDGAALWSIRPGSLANSQVSPNKLGQELQLPRWASAPVSSQKEPTTSPKKDERVWDMCTSQVLSSAVTQKEKPWNGCEPQNPWASGLTNQIDQSGTIPISTPVSHGVAKTLWDIQVPPGIPKTVNSAEKLVNNQDFQLQPKQVSPGWSNVQTATQKLPIPIQYEPHRFGQAVPSPVWGFQSNPQPLLTGQLKRSGAQELQQQPMVTRTQIIINQPPPFFSPPLTPLPPLALSGPHPLHPVPIGAIARPPHPNIFFTPQAVMSDRTHIQQALSLPQLPPQTEPHKLGNHLPFAPERLLQCMICGCSMPRELDLQLHYLQHAQGEI